MAHHNHQEILDHLRDHLGFRVDGSEQQGRKKIIDTLVEHLNYDTSQAEVIFEQLATHGDIRYLRDDNSEFVADQNDTTLHGGSAAHVANSGLGVGATAPAIAGDIDLDTDEGFWEIGAEHEDERSMGVRKGQVRPRGV